MSPPSRSLGYLHSPWRRVVEVGFWVWIALSNAATASVTVNMDVQRLGLPFAPWEPVVWEWSSNLVFLALVPAVLAFTRRFPLHWDTWRRRVPQHLAASLAFSFVHVVGMVALRHVAYAVQGDTYDFGHWPRQLFYEYLKDAGTYLWMVFVIEGYRLFLRRLQGEARLLDPPEEGEPVEPVERPERFLVRKLGREFLVAAAEIEWAQASGNYVNLRVRGHDYPLRITLSGLEERLDPHRFERIHRSYLVNLDQIASIEPQDTGDARVHLKDGAVLPCSRRYREALRTRLAPA